MSDRAMFYSGLFCIAFGCAVMWYFQHTQGIGFGLVTIGVLAAGTGTLVAALGGGRP